MENFPDALLLEILQRLPVKSIFRFKSVSKRWFSIISDPFFAHTYRINNHHLPPWTLISSCWNNRFLISPPGHMAVNNITLVHHPDFTSPGFSLQFLAATPDPEEQQNFQIKLLASSNGLLLYCSMDSCLNLHYNVCNPLTMKRVSLPKPLCHPKSVKEGVLADNDSGNFWVARVAELQWRSKVFNVEIFSSESGEWRYSKVYCPRRIRFFVKDRPTVSYRGVLHWLVDNYTILAFDPKSDSNECRLIDLPTDRESRIPGVLGISCALLHYAEVADTYLEQFQTPSLRVWHLTDYDAGEWRLMYRIKLSDIWSADAYLSEALSSLGHYMRALAFHPFDSDTVFLKSIYNCNHQLVVYKHSAITLEVVNRELQFQESREYFHFVLPIWPTPVPQSSWETD